VRAMRSSAPTPLRSPTPAKTAAVGSTFLGELVWLDPRRWAPLLGEVPKEIWVVAIAAAVGLTLHELVFLPSRANSYIGAWLPSLAHYLRNDGAPWRGVARFAWWSGGSLLVWVILPLAAGRVLAKRSPADYGLARLPLRKTAPYLAILAV